MLTNNSLDFFGRGCLLLYQRYKNGTRQRYNRNLYVTLIPPSLAAVLECLEGQICYNAGKTVNGPTPKENAKKLTDCYCNCFKDGYFFATWNEKG